jgi:hypothetical protein
VQWKHQLTLTESKGGKYYLVIKQGKDELTKGNPSGKNGKIKIKIIIKYRMQQHAEKINVGRKQ